MKLNFFDKNHLKIMRYKCDNNKTFIKKCVNTY